jgi:cysteinyl-tRNA synthetase
MGAADAHNGSRVTGFLTLLFNARISQRERTAARRRGCFAVTLTLYNTLTRRKEPFTPIDPANVRMYVCGPTVYDYAHIGNARPIIVFDVLYRLLRHVYGPDHVTYARNITDVDDKINARAVERFPDIEPVAAIKRLTEETTAQFHKDISVLGVLPPTHEPRATEYIEQMKDLCATLVARGHAYVAEDHVLFDASSMADYGRLANRSLDEMIAGARVDVAPYKKNATDFVLWKPSTAAQPGWPSPCGIVTPGRPGWHIECSAMAGALLGNVFDIHGGGIDLVFPHHENEIAQSRCAHGTPVMANVWMHNGFLQVEGEKMSKSLGNFVTINELLETTKFGGRRWPGAVLRLAMLKTHYRQPIDWTVGALEEAVTTLARWQQSAVVTDQPPNDLILNALADDLNLPAALSEMHRLRAAGDSKGLGSAMNLLGLVSQTIPADGIGSSSGVDTPTLRNVRGEIVDVAAVTAQISARLDARRRKDFKESDRIRDELAAMGIQLKDSKDPVTGEPATTWEVKR